MLMYEGINTRNAAKSCLKCSDDPMVGRESRSEGSYRRRYPRVGVQFSTRLRSVNRQVLLKTQRTVLYLQKEQVLQLGVE